MTGHCLVAAPGFPAELFGHAMLGNLTTYEFPNFLFPIQMVMAVGGTKGYKALFSLGILYRMF